MSNNVTESHVHSLITKAAKSDNSGDAMKYAQAAVNAANAIATLKACAD